MQLCLENIGMIKNAQIELCGITVIAGINDTGKSTVGKVLYSIYNGLNHYTRNIDKYKVESALKDINIQELRMSIPEYSTTPPPTPYPTNPQWLFLQSIVSMDFDYTNVGKITSTFEEILKTIESDKNMEPNKKDRLTISIRNALKKLKIAPDSNFFKISALDSTLRTEFHNQINNVFNDNIGKIIVKHNDIEIDLNISKNSILDDATFSYLSFKDATFIDKTPDFNSLYREKRNISHNDDIIYKLQNSPDTRNIIDNISNDEKNKKINSYFSSIIKGTIEESLWGFNYSISGQKINMENLSTGLKSFSVLKVLFDNNHITSDSILIIDEPEVHLHPKWQLNLAELIVILAKEIGVNILLTSHSPYFIEAIEVFSKKYKFAEKTRFYFAEKNDNLSEITEVTNDLQKIYATLAEPFQKFADILAEMECDDGD